MVCFTVHEGSSAYIYWKWEEVFHLPAVPDCCPFCIFDFFMGSRISVLAMTAHGAGASHFSLSHPPLPHLLGLQSIQKLLNRVSLDYYYHCSHYQRSKSSKFPRNFWVLASSFQIQKHLQKHSLYLLFTYSCVPIVEISLSTSDVGLYPLMQVVQLMIISIDTGWSTRIIMQDPSHTLFWCCLSSAC